MLSKEVLKALPYIILLVAGSMLWKSRNSSKDLLEEVNKYELQIKALQQSINSYNVENKNLELKADSLYSLTKKSDIKIEALTNNLHEARKQAKEKTIAAESFTNSELELFFSNRYARD